MITSLERHELVEQLVPEGTIVTRHWLMAKTSLGEHAIDNLVKSKRLKVLRRGLYARGNVRLSWQSVVHTLQTIMKTDHVVGGLTALELKGFSHYLPTSKREVIQLYGNDKLPFWIKDIVDNTTFIRHNRRQLFASMESSMVDDYVSSFFWKEGMEDLKISCPEKACLEMLNEVPNKISFEHADQLIQGMTTLSPRILQTLLEQCTNVKVKRLFLWFGSRHNYTWYTKLKTDNIDIGSGNRTISIGGQLDKNYAITIPKDFQV